MIELSPQAPAGYYSRGVARFEAKLFDKAMEDLSKAIEMEPRFINAYQLAKGLGSPGQERAGQPIGPRRNRWCSTRSRQPRMGTCI